MAHATHSDLDLGNDDIERVAGQLRQRLEARGIQLHEQDNADELGSITEAVEAFEAAVEARGGDLMVDEPPTGKRAQPDDPSFVIPQRDSKESAHAFVSRIEAATAQLRA